MEPSSLPSTSAFPHACYLDFLADDACPSLFMDLLDPQTLQAVCTNNTDVLGPLPQPPSEDTRKKLMEQDSDSDVDEGSGASKGVGGASGGGGGGSNKRARSEANQAAKNKATREKARREKINDRFSELAQLIDPGKEPKTDKPSILQDAIKCVQQMRMENHQLRQLNKFLEERMGQLERERGQNLYQQSLMMQHGGGMMGLPGMPGHSSLPFQPPHSSASTSASAQQVAAAAAAMAAAGGSTRTPGASTSSAPYPSMRMPTASASGRPSAAGPTAGFPGNAFAAAAAAAVAAAADQSGAGEKRSGTPPIGAPRARVPSPKLPQAGAEQPSLPVGLAGSAQEQGAPAAAQLQGEGAGAEGEALEGQLQLPSAAFPTTATKLGQQPGGLHMGAAAPWFPGLGDVGLGEPLFGGNWVKPEMLDSMHDSLLRPPAA